MNRATCQKILLVSLIDINQYATEIYKKYLNLVRNNIVKLADLAEKKLRSSTKWTY